MKSLYITFLCLVIHLSTTAHTDYAQDVSSEDAILTALYDVISGDAGVGRDWARFKNLFFDGAQLIPIVKKEDGTIL